MPDLETHFRWGPLDGDVSLLDLPEGDSVPDMLGFRLGVTDPNGDTSTLPEQECLHLYKLCRQQLYGCGTVCLSYRYAGYRWPGGLPEPAVGLK